MFIVVRHGGDEKLLFNPWCRVANLLSDIKQRCNFPLIDIQALDLCDEAGLVKDLPLNLQACASKFLPSPGTYVVVERRRIPIEKQNTDSQGDETEGEEARPMETVFTSLLNNADKLIPGFTPRAATKHLGNPKETRKGRRTKEDKVLATPPSPTPRATSTMKANKTTKGRPKNTR